MIKTLPDIIRSGFKTFPNRTAFKCGVNEETYESMFLKMNLLSNQLRALGVKKGDRVGILMHRSIECAIAVYGILHAGAAFVPIDPAAPGTRVKFILNDCNIEILISSPIQKKILSDIAAEGTSIGTIVGLNSSELDIQTIPWEDVFTLDNSINDVLISEDDLAYIMFTSGSTGIPKGIMHTHKSGLNYARLSSELYELSENDVVGNVAPLFFDQCTFGYFSAPLAVATTILFQDGQLAMLGSFSHLIEKEKVTILYSVPLIFIQLIESNLLKGFKSLTWILYGGEPFPPKKLNKIIKILPHIKISNIYGPAEVNQCTYNNILATVDENKSVPLGKVWSETTVKIIDEFDQEVEPGEAGELLVSSSTMMKGYWNNVDLNKKAFYIEQNGEGETIYYRTGDIVRYDPENELIFIGRKDRQAKVRGYRVELGEIENALCLMEGIHEAAVYISELNDEKSLCASVTYDEKHHFEVKKLKSHLQQFVPKYSIPEYFDAMDELPRTKNGKIDYNILEKQMQQINQRY